jgi:hypothetical protein
LFCCLGPGAAPPPTWAGPTKPAARPGWGGRATAPSPPPCTSEASPSAHANILRGPSHGCHTVRVVLPYRTGMLSGPSGHFCYCFLCDSTTSSVAADARPCNILHPHHLLLAPNPSLVFVFFGVEGLLGLLLEMQKLEPTHDRCLEPLHPRQCCWQPPPPPPPPSQ